MKDCFCQKSSSLSLHLLKLVQEIKSYESSKLVIGCFGGQRLGSRIRSPNFISIHLKIYRGISIFSRMFTSSRNGINIIFLI